jgi:ABC-type Mn2+/Zn2+ transport system ATPase subunit
MKPVIRLSHATLGYDRPVLRDVTLELQRGDYLGIVGPNGCGKTTLLKAILGILRPLSGTVETPRGSTAIGYVPQRDTLDSFFPLSVLDIVLMGLYDQLGAAGRPGAAHRAQAIEALAQAGIADLRDRPYPSLSGGQKQRTIIARALVSHPEVLILDEPTNGMDLPAEESILELIGHLHDEHAITVLLVSHLLHVVMNNARHIAVVSDGGLSVFTRAEIISGSHLSGLYGIPVEVVQVNGRAFAVATRHVSGESP